MAQTGYTPIQLYKSSTAAAAPVAGNLLDGELAINTADGKLFYKDSGGSVQVLATKAGANGDVVGPASATDNALARFDATTGKLIQNSAGILDDSGNLSGIATLTAATLTPTNAVGVAYGGSGRASATAYAVLCGGTTSTGAHQSVTSVGTAGQVLTSNGPGALPTFQAAAGFAAGTKLLFAQTAAPTGWTKDTTNYNNYALRVVTGAASSGGSVDFTTAFASQTPSGSVSVNTSGLSAGATTLSTAQMPSHTHTYGAIGVGSYTACGGAGGGLTNTGATGGGGSHTHSISGSATGSFTGNAINLAVKYLDTILATKD